MSATPRVTHTPLISWWLLLGAAGARAAPDPVWQHLSSKRGEIPAPNFDRITSWKRRGIKSGGKSQHHDQCFGDFLGTGQPQLAIWNQQAKTLFLAEIPADPRGATNWPITPVLTNAQPAGVPYVEGAFAFDVDADGQLDILACDSWFKHTGGKSLKQVQFALGMRRC